MTAVPDRRRDVLRAACGHCLAWGFGLHAGAASAQMPLAPDISSARLGRPAAETDEGGLWALMDREEARLRRSPLAIRDPRLTAYLEELVCRLGGEHCRDVRVHVLRTPHFNATMAPNGMMQVWSGLLLRMENEAQLAAVLGHEIGHYLERHSVERLRDAKSRAAAGQIMSLFGLPGVLASIAVMAGGSAFSREQELQADAIGLRLLHRAGYDTSAAAQVWDNLIGELKASGGEDAGRRSLMMALHPPAAERRDQLRRLSDGTAGRLAPDEFHAAMAPHRLGWLLDELRRGQFEESLALLDRLLAVQPADALLLFGRGEAYRQRDASGDALQAVADLQAATALPHAPAEAHRALGLLLRTQQDDRGAAQAFRRYLAHAPDAGDAPLIQHYLSELKP